MPKNIVICCDGTNNEFGVRNTNVVRLYQCLADKTITGQIAYYDPGVGTLAAPQMLTKIGKKLSRIAGMAIGAGILDNVEEVIRFLMIHYEPEDRIYMFGFSRGAYTARMVAGMLRKCGLPTLGNEGLLPYMRNLYRIRQDQSGLGLRDVSDDFKRTFGTRCPVHFLGLWDTVSAVGIVWNPDAFPFTFKNDEVSIVRHAIAVDERRGFFRTNRWGQALPLAQGSGASQSVEQLWFPGVHSDVGGGYTDGELWKHPFGWMVREAQTAGMRVDQAKLDAILGANRAEWHRSPQHDSLTLAWKLASIFPKKVKAERNGTWESSYQFSFPKMRSLRLGEPLHRSVVERWRDIPAYRPPNLDPVIMDRLVSQLTNEIVSLPYS
jgi:uncharacterized protein (DUF2235 family)